MARALVAAAVALALALACGGGAAPASPTEWEISTRLGGASAEDVERRLLQPIEQALIGLPGVERVEGFAGGGEATVRVRLRSDDRAPLLDALGRVSLPAEAEVPVLEPASPSRWLVVPEEDAERARWTLAAEPGVVGVEVHGLVGEQLVVRLDAERLAAYGVEVRDVRRALGSASPAAGGAIPAHEVGHGVLGASGLEPLEDLVVATRQGMPVRLGDVATLERTRAHGPRAFSEGRPVAVLEVFSGRSDLAAAVPTARALDPLTRVEVRGGAAWAEDLRDEPGAVVLIGAGTYGHTAWLPEEPDDARARFGAYHSVDFVVRDPAVACEEVILAGENPRVLQRGAVEAVREVVPSSWSRMPPPRLEVHVRDHELPAGEIREAVALLGSSEPVSTWHDGEGALDVLLRVDELADLRFDGRPFEGRVLYRDPIPHVDGRRGVVLEVCGAEPGALADLRLPDGVTRVSPR